MIKTIIELETQKLDQAVNDFMAARRQNLPVRTESYVVVLGSAAKVYHKATVFFDERFEPKPQPGREDISEEDIMAMSQPEEPKANGSSKLGSLWVQKDRKTVSGNFCNERVVIPEAVAQRLVALGPSDNIDLTMKGQKVIVMPNKFKKTEKHPDFVILKRSE